MASAFTLPTHLLRVEGFQPNDCGDVNLSESRNIVGVDKSLVPQSLQFHSVVAIVNLIFGAEKIARGPCVTFGAIYKSVQR